MPPANWLRNSTKHLQEAELIGERTNSLLQYTRKSLQKRDYYDTRGCFLLDALRQQQMVLSAIVKSIGVQVDSKRQEMSSLQREVKEAIEALQRSYDDLKKVNVPRSLKECTLYDFVSDDMLDVLLQKRASLSLGHDLVYAMEQEYRTVKKLQLELPEDYGIDSTALIATVNEIQDSEEQIAAILESLTSHYDQCTKGVAVEKGELQLSNVEKDELFAVLEKDDKELPDILIEITECFEELKSRCDSIHIDRERYDELVQKCSKFREFGRVLNGSKSALDNTIAQLTKLSSGIHVSCTEASNLCVHYDQFQASYGKFLEEIIRRRELQAKMMAIVQETQKSLQTMSRQDQKFRSEFLEGHGDSLPLDLWNKLPTDELVSLQVRQSQLPEL